MKMNALYIVLGLLLLSTTVFAAAETGVTDTTITISVVNPLTGSTFFKAPVDLNAIGIGDVPLDFNSDSMIWYSVNDANFMLNGIYNPLSTPTEFMVGVPAWADATKGDKNFKFIISNGQGDENFTNGWVHAWADENAPSSTHGTVDSEPGKVTIPVYCSDGMTSGVEATADNNLPEVLEGSGCAGVWYTDNGGAWTYIAGYRVDYTAPVDIKVTGTGEHTIYWCVTNALDNNSCDGIGEWVKYVDVDAFGSVANVCGLVGMVLFVLIAMSIIVIIIGAYNMATGGFDVNVLVMIAVAAMTILIVSYVSTFVTSIICVA